MKLLIRQSTKKGNCLYINFEDPYFLTHHEPQVIEDIISVYKEYFNKDLQFIFFDEIQEITAWEKAVRKLRDSQRYKIFLSGSSAKLLSREFSSLLTGRHLSYQLLPLSFREYLMFSGIDMKTAKESLNLKTSPTEWLVKAFVSVEKL